MKHGALALCTLARVLQLGAAREYQPCVVSQLQLRSAADGTPVQVEQTGTATYTATTCEGTESSRLLLTITPAVAETGLECKLEDVPKGPIEVKSGAQKVIKFKSIAALRVSE